jgi:hypothetical protein
MPVHAQPESKRNLPLIKPNWITNPGAEADAWKPNGWSFSVADDALASGYGMTVREWDFGCDEKCGLPPKAGNNYFRLDCQPDREKVSNYRDLYQQITVQSLKDSLQKFPIEARCSGWLAGYPTVGTDCAIFRVALRFLDAGNKVIDSTDLFKSLKDFKDLDAVVDDDHPMGGKMHKFIPFTLSRQVPKETASVQVFFSNDNRCTAEGQEYTSVFCFDNLGLAFYRKEEK